MQSYMTKVKKDGFKLEQVLNHQKKKKKKKNNNNNKGAERFTFEGHVSPF